MAWIITRSILWGIAGLIAAPIVTLVVVLGMSYLLDDRCGSPGDSGGCEMGSFAAAVAMALPGLALGFFVSLILGLRKRRLEQSSPPQA